MNDRPDVTVTARYELPDTATPADLVDILLSVPADARISFSVPTPPAQSYAVAEVSQPRALIARWTVPAGQPISPPSADETPAAGWSGPQGITGLVGRIEPPKAPARTHARGCTLDTDHDGPCKPPFASGRVTGGLDKRRINAIDLGGTGL